MTFSECDHVFGADINHCRAVCLRHRRSFSQGSAGLRVAPALAHISGKWLLCPLSPQGGAGSCDELWQHLGFAPTLLEINAMFCFVLFSCLRAERFVIFFFFFLCISFYQCHCPCASKHLCSPQPELRWRSQDLKGFVVVAFMLSLPGCVFSSSKQMYGTSSGKEGGDVTKWIVPTHQLRSCKNIMNLVSQNHEYNNKKYI